MRIRCWTFSFLGLALAAAPQAAGQAESSAGAATLTVGSAEEIDTEAIRRVINENPGARGPRAPATPGEAWSLTLEEALRVALERNLRLQIAVLDRDAQEHEVPAQRAFFHPTPGFNLVATDSWIANPLDIPDDDDPNGITKDSGRDENTSQNAEVFVRQEVPTGGTVTLFSGLLREAGDDFGGPGSDVYAGNARLELRQPLMRGGRVFVATQPIRNAEFDLGVLESTLRAEVLRVTAETKQAYYAAILAQRLIEVTQQAMERDRRLIDASEALFGAGRASKRDIVSAQIRLSDDQSDLAIRTAELERAYLRLKDVVGIPIGASLTLAEQSVPFEPVDIREEDWIARALADRPEIHAILERLDQATLQARVASNAVLPKLDMVGLFARDDFEATSRRAFGMDSQHWLAGLQFEIPFGNVAARERESSARLLRARTERELVNQQRLIEAEVRTEVIDLLGNLEDLEAQTTKVEQARSKLEIALERYRRGLANNKDVIDAQEDLVDAESDLLSAVVDYASGVARLEARIAGPL